MDNLNLTRYELSLIIAGLHRVRDEIRNELKDEGVEDLFTRDEYRGLVALQEKILQVRDKMAY